MGAQDGNRAFSAVEALNRAGDWQTFQAAVGLFDLPATNFVYADAEGNIGYVMSGRVP
ncbi:MAG: penicillin acylase family protein, partial [Anaerolineae bacterium]|nr:penicillin acylase family protein [Anaerolineae bacterium]